MLVCSHLSYTSPATGVCNSTELSSTFDFWPDTPMSSPGLQRSLSSTGWTKNNKCFGKCYQ